MSLHVVLTRSQNDNLKKTGGSVSSPFESVVALVTCLVDTILFQNELSQPQIRSSPHPAASASPASPLLRTPAHSRALPRLAVGNGCHAVGLPTIPEASTERESTGEARWLG